MRFAARSNRGLKRPDNQDAVLARPHLGLFAVADGMGGHQHGGEASRLAVETLERTVANVAGETEPAGMGPVLQAALELAHEKIVDFSLNQAGGHTVGTTATVLWLKGGQAWVAHVGDSRLYTLRDGVLQQQTKDHTMVQEAIDLGRLTPEQAEHSPYKNALTRALGGKRGHGADVFSLDLQPGDLVLLASDGLFKEVPEAGIAAVLNTPHTSLDARADVLVDAALAAGGSDNISFILLDLEMPQNKEAGGLLARSARFFSAITGDTGLPGRRRKP